MSFGFLDPGSQLLHGSKAVALGGSPQLLAVELLISFFEQIVDIGRWERFIEFGFPEPLSDRKDLTCSIRGAKGEFIGSVTDDWPCNLFVINYFEHVICNFTNHIHCVASHGLPLRIHAKPPRLEQIVSVASAWPLHQEDIEWEGVYFSTNASPMPGMVLGISAKATSIFGIETEQQEAVTQILRRPADPGE